jgi:mannose-6-phosphate isomerase-like protein (cupin superfamily)
VNHLSSHLKRFLDAPELIRTIHKQKDKKINVLFETADVIVFYSELDIGEELLSEKHDVVEVIFRLEGKTRHLVGDKEYLVEEDMVLEIPQFTEHSCKVEGDKKVKQLTLLARNQYYENFFTK